jgi:hypothetical protein
MTMPENLLGEGGLDWALWQRLCRVLDAMMKKGEKKGEAGDG